MPRKKKTVIEFRNYNLPANFPVILLHGEHWRISDIPSGRLHIHNCLEIGLCRSDGGTMVFEDTACTFQEGDVTAVSCDVPHTTYSRPGTQSMWSYLFVDLEELFHPFFPGVDLSGEEMFRALNHHLNLIMRKEEYPVIYSLVNQLIEELIKKEKNYEISVRGLFLSLATNLARIADAATLEKEDQPENALVIAPALEYIRYHYMTDFPMDNLAALCGLSPTHFRRLFSSVTGKSPLEHLLATRVKRAADLLRITEDSILKVSEQVGFHSLSSFNRHFHAIMGETPRDWKKRMSIVKDQSVLKYHGWMAAEKLPK